MLSVVPLASETSTLFVRVNPTADPYLTLDPDGTGIVGVSQLGAFFTDTANAVYMGIVYVPQYLQPN
jgi:hypothetical protein